MATPVDAVSDPATPNPVEGDAGAGMPPPLPPAPTTDDASAAAGGEAGAPPALPTPPPPMPEAPTAEKTETPVPASADNGVAPMDDGKEAAAEKRPLEEATGGDAPPADQPPRKKRRSRFDDAPPADAMPPPLPVADAASNGADAAAGDKNQKFLNAIKVAQQIAAGRAVSSNAFSAEIVVPKAIAEDKGVNFIGLVIGPGGMTQKMIMSEMKARVNIKGRGSSKSGVDEDPDRDLYVAISADSQDKVDQAKDFINNLINSEDARRVLREQQNKQRQAASRFSDTPPIDGLTAPDGSGTTAVAPSPWGANGAAAAAATAVNASAAAAAAAAAIAQSYGAATHRAGGGKREVIKIPSHRVGIVIGRGGETIMKIQRESGAHVQVERDSNPDEPEKRAVTIEGSPEQIERAKAIIDKYTSGGNDNARLDNPKDFMWVPRGAVGMIIGKGGEKIRHMQQTTGCNIQVIPETHPNGVGENGNRKIALDGTDDVIKAARQEIQQVIDSHERRGGGDFGPHSGGGTGPALPPGAVSEIVKVPSHCIGTFIGRGGENVKKLAQHTSTKIQVLRDDRGNVNDRNDANSDFRQVEIRGLPDAIHFVKGEIQQIIDQKAEERNIAPYQIMGGGNNQGGGGNNGWGNNQGGYNQGPPNNQGGGWGNNQGGGYNQNPPNNNQGGGWGNSQQGGGNNGWGNQSGGNSGWGNNQTPNNNGWGNNPQGGGNNGWGNQGGWGGQQGGWNQQPQQGGGWGQQPQQGGGWGQQPQQSGGWGNQQGGWGNQQTGWNQQPQQQQQQQQQQPQQSQQPQQQQQQGGWGQQPQQGYNQQQQQPQQSAYAGGYNQWGQQGQQGYQQQPQQQQTGGYQQQPQQQQPPQQQQQYGAPPGIGQQGQQQAQQQPQQQQQGWGQQQQWGQQMQQGPPPGIGGQQGDAGGAPQNPPEPSGPPPDQQGGGMPMNPPEPSGAPPHMPPEPQGPPPPQQG